MPQIESCACANCTFARQVSEEQAYSVRANQRKVEVLVTLCTYAYWWLVFITVALGSIFWRASQFDLIQPPFFFLFSLVVLIMYLFFLIFLGNLINSTTMQMHAAGLGVVNPLTLAVLLATGNIIVFAIIWIVLFLINLFFLSIGFYSKKPSSNINN